MTVVRPNSIAGINSITVQNGQALNIHDANGNLIRNITSSTGISTLQSLEITKGTGDLTVGVSTFFVDNSATNVGVGTNVPYNNAGTNVHIHSANTTSEIRFTNSTTGGGNNGGTIQQGGTTLYVSNSESGNIVFENNGSERLRLDSSGRLLLGTTTEGDTAADDLTVATSGATGITIRSGSTSTGNIYFSDGTSGGAEYAGYLQYNHSTNSLSVGTNGEAKLNIYSDGNIHIFKAVNVVGVSTFKGKVGFDTTSAIKLPRGSTSERPTDTSTTTPYMRWNSTNSALEVYNGSEWVEIITDYFPSGSTAFS